MTANLRTFFAAGLCALLALWGRSASGMVVLFIDDPLNGSTVGTQQGGSWAAGGGWQAAAGDVRITWDLGDAYGAGRFEVDVRNFDPCSQPNNQKCHIMSMWQSTNQTRGSSDAADEGHWIFRTGQNYFNPCEYKLLTRPTGPFGGHEARIDTNFAWNTNVTYHYVLEWESNGRVRLTKDGNVLYDHTHGNPLFLRYLLVGRDHETKPNYGEQPGVIYSNVRVYVDTDFLLCNDPCSDGDPCTTNDHCQGYACVGDPMVCDAPPSDCHEPAGTCQSGQCTYALRPDGSACDDSDACTQVDVCQSGGCVGMDDVVCAAQDECHLPGQCEPATGSCSNPAADDGTPCSGGVCVSGVCTSDPDGGLPPRPDGGGTDDGDDGGSGGPSVTSVTGGCACRAGAPKRPRLPWALLLLLAIPLGLQHRRKRPPQ